MKPRSLQKLGLPVMMSILILGAGCATSGDLESTKKMAQDAKTSADQANRTAADVLAS